MIGRWFNCPQCRAGVQYTQTALEPSSHPKMRWHVIECQSCHTPVKLVPHELYEGVLTTETHDDLNAAAKAINVSQTVLLYMVFVTRYDLATIGLDATQADTWLWDWISDVSKAPMAMEADTFGRLCGDLRRFVEGGTP